MSGKKGRQWASFRFRWKVVDGEQAGQFVERETPVPDKLTPATAYAQWVGYLLGRQIGAEAFDLTACLGKRYMVTVGEKKNKQGQPTGWLHVEQCIKLPDA